MSRPGLCAITFGMAKRTVVETLLTDDLDGSPADRTVTFAFEGQQYEMELSKRNAGAFEKALAPYVGHARKVRGVARSNGRKPTSPTRNDPAFLREVRAWAAKNNFQVSDRGRIPESVMAAYQEAH